MLKKFLNSFITITTIIILSLVVNIVFSDSAFAVEKTEKKIVNTKKETKKTRKTIKKQHKTASITTEPLPVGGNLEDNINYILSKFHGNYNIGIAVKSLDSGNLLYAKNPNSTFVPASSLKLFTGVAALDYLGPNYTFSTEYLGDNPTPYSNGTLSGNLYIKFSGDPYLTLDTLKAMTNSLLEQGIKSIQGNIVIDDTAIDRETWQSGRVIKDKILCYAAPVTATIINRNCFSFDVNNTRNANSASGIRVNQNLGDILIENQIITGRKKQHGCVLDLKPTVDNHYVLSGCMAPRATPLSLAVALQNPNLATSNIMAKLFKNAGISYNQVIFGKTPANAQVLTKNDSPELATMVKRMLKKSDNLIADSLLKKLGGVYFSTQGSWENGVKAIHSILGEKTGIDFQNIIMVDGSGLSRDNQVTPEDFVKLLSFAYNKMPNNSLFYDALPRSGIDGTLRFRLAGPVVDRVHAKTGTMEGTSALAGYIRTANDKKLAFAILVNEAIPGRNNQGSYHLLENRICEYLARSNING